MTLTSFIPIVDLFAGPGGLGEGFTSLKDGRAFKIAVSAEMDTNAHKTLRHRAFYRILKKQGGKALESYYDFCNGVSEEPFNASTIQAWKESGEEAQLLTLGISKDNDSLRKIINKCLV